MNVRQAMAKANKRIDAAIIASVSRVTVCFKFSIAVEVSMRLRKTEQYLVTGPDACGIITIDWSTGALLELNSSRYHHKQEKKNKK